MFRLALAVLVLVSAVSESLAADPSFLNGRVLDVSGDPVAGAAITLYEQAGSIVFRAASNDQGEFFFISILPGSYLLEAHTRDLSSPQAYPVRLTPGINPDVQLVLVVSALVPRVVVTPAAAPQSAEHTSKALDSVSAADVQARGLFLAADALRFLPGFQVDTFAGPGAYTLVQTRGLPPADTAVLIDGSPFRDPASRHDDAATLLGELLLVDTSRVEALRGPGSSLYGTGAVSGTVNLLTAGGGGPVHGDLDLQGGGLSLFEGVAHVAGGVAQNKLTYLAGFARLDDDFAREWSGQGQVQYEIAPSIHVGADLFGTTADEEVGPSPGPSHFFDGLFRFSQEVTPAFSYRLSYATLTTERDVADPNPDKYRGRLDTLNARTSYRLGEQQIVSAGYEYSRERYAQPLTNTDVGQQFQSAYAQDDLKLLASRLEILLSGRFTDVNLAHPESAWAGDSSAAYFFKRAATKVRAHVGTSFRLPSLYERLVYSYTSPERVVSGDAGIDQYLWQERIEVSATYFYSDLQHGTLPDMGQGIARGLELSAALRPVRHTSINASYTYTNADLTGPELLPLLRNELKLVVQRDFGRFDTALDFEGGSSYLLPGSSDRFDGPRQLGVAAGYHVPIHDRITARLYARLSNTLNQRYVYESFPTPRRWGVLGLHLIF